MSGPAAGPERSARGLRSTVVLYRSREVTSNCRHPGEADAVQGRRIALPVEQQAANPTGFVS